MVLRIEMDHDDEGRAGILGQDAEERLQRKDAARGRADADNRQIGCFSHACTPGMSSGSTRTIGPAHRGRRGASTAR